MSRLWGEVLKSMSNYLTTIWFLSMIISSSVFVFFVMTKTPFIITLMLGIIICTFVPLLYWLEREPKEVKKYE